MTRQELIEKVATVNKGTPKTLVKNIIETTFDTIVNVVKKEKKFTYQGFGTWSLKNRKPRKGRNPQTGEIIKIKATRTVAFRPSKTLKDRL